MEHGELKMCRSQADVMLWNDSSSFIICVHIACLAASIIPYKAIIQSPLGDDLKVLQMATVIIKGI